MNALVQRLSSMTETKVILGLLAAIAITYWICIILKSRPFNLQELVALVFNTVGGITGVYIFIGATKIPDSSSEHAIWLGIGGVCLSLFFFEQVRLFFKVLLVRTSDSRPSSEERAEECGSAVDRSGEKLR
ncbi:MAG: hypothetical protein ACRD8A_05505 [Candidatus Acidiferrales bacterium]